MSSEWWVRTDKSASAAINQRRVIERAQRLQEEFLTAAAPYLRIMADVRAVQQVRWIKRTDGRLEGPKIMWQPGWKEIYDGAEQAVDRLREEFEARVQHGR